MKFDSTSIVLGAGSALIVYTLLSNREYFNKWFQSSSASIKISDDKTHEKLAPTQLANLNTSEPTRMVIDNHQQSHVKVSEPQVPLSTESASASQILWTATYCVIITGAGYLIYNYKDTIWYKVQGYFDMIANSTELFLSIPNASFEIHSLNKCITTYESDYVSCRMKMMSVKDDMTLAQSTLAVLSLGQQVEVLRSNRNASSTASVGTLESLRKEVQSLKDRKSQLEDRLTLLKSVLKEKLSISLREKRIKAWIDKIFKADDALDKAFDWGSEIGIISLEYVIGRFLDASDVSDFVEWIQVWLPKIYQKLAKRAVADMSSHGFELDEKAADLDDIDSFDYLNLPVVSEHEEILSNLDTLKSFLHLLEEPARPASPTAESVGELSPLSPTASEFEEDGEDNKEQMAKAFLIKSPKFVESLCRTLLLLCIPPAPLPSSSAIIMPSDDFTSGGATASSYATMKDRIISTTEQEVIARQKALDSMHISDSDYLDMRILAAIEFSDKGGKFIRYKILVHFRDVVGSPSRVSSSSAGHFVISPLPGKRHSLTPKTKLPVYSYYVSKRYRELEAIQQEFDKHLKSCSKNLEKKYSLKQVEEFKQARTELKAAWPSVKGFILNDAVKREARYDALQRWLAVVSKFSYLKEGGPLHQKLKEHFLPKTLPTRLDFLLQLGEVYLKDHIQEAFRKFTETATSMELDAVARLPVFIAGRVLDQFLKDAIDCEERGKPYEALKPPAI